MSSAYKSKPSITENQETDEEQPQPPDYSRRQEDTSPLTAIGILDSIIGSNVNPHTSAGDILSGTAGAAGMEYVNVPRPSGTARGSTEFYEMCTEILGFESMLEKMDLSKVIEEHSSRLVTSSSRKTKMRRVRVIPPFLSTLFFSGRPRFSLKKVTGSDGRLNIVMVDYTADLVGGGEEVAMARDDQEVDGGIDELKNDDHEMSIGDRQDDRENKEDMAADDRIEEMIGDNLFDQDGYGEMIIGDRQDDDANDENREEEVTGDDRYEGDYR